MVKVKHIHQYQAVTLGKNYRVYRCVRPDCSHYLPARLVFGKRSLCNRCGKEIEMDNFALSLDKPHCVTCTKKKTKKGKEIHESIAAISEMDLPILPSDGPLVDE